jgi:hypothetical protein
MQTDTRIAELEQEVRDLKQKIHNGPSDIGPVYDYGTAAEADGLRHLDFDLTSLTHQQERRN